LQRTWRLRATWPAAPRHNKTHVEKYLNCELRFKGKRSKLYWKYSNPC
jgi:hypothetical protein